MFFANRYFSFRGIYFPSFRRVTWLCISFFSLLFPVITRAGSWNLDGVYIITREQWGADESIRYKSTYGDQSNPNTSTEPKDPNTKNSQISSVRSTYMKMNFPNDWRYDKTVNTLNGELLIYPDQINNHKTKIIVHHTATTYDQSWGPAEILKSLKQIYKYHTIDRNFGDIGYNFLIDHLGNIYEGRAGGEGAAGMHASYNNVATIGISLLGNFENYSPTQAQVNALTDLITALSKKYNIDPAGSEFYFSPTTTSPYIVAKKLPTIVGHKDVAATACPGKLLYPLLPSIRTEVKNRLSGQTPKQVTIYNLQSQHPEEQTTNAKTTTKETTSFGEVQAPKTTTSSTSKKTFSEKLANLQQKNPGLLVQVRDLVRSRYKGTLPKATNLSQKMLKTITLAEAKQLVQTSLVDVLLYELTTKYTEFHLQCEHLCTVHYQAKKADSSTSLSASDVKIQFKGGTILLTVGSDTFSVDHVTVQDTQDTALVTISNYSRASYAGIPWNTFRGKLSFYTDTYMTVEGKKVTGPLVKNTLSFSDYMKGVVETNDQETLEKNKVMALIAKNYALFYLDKSAGNIHPSIPAGSAYTAIDSPEMFQKYVGAGAEKTLTKRYEALEATKNQIVLYDGILPILPYFSCSAGFTLSAQEKRGWTDTPWLRSVYDFGGCKEFAGHGVGLAGQGAEWFAKQGMKAEQILQWYYPGVELVSL